MEFNVWTFLFEIVNFVVLAYILHRLLYRPLRGPSTSGRPIWPGYNTRRKRRADANALQARMQAELAELEKQQTQTIQEAHGLAAAEAQQLLAENEQSIARRQEEVRAAIERQRQEAWKALRGEMSSAAARLAERLLQEAAGTSLQSQLAGRLSETLTQLSEDERLRMRRDWAIEDGAVLETAAPLDAASTRQIGDAVATLLGRKVDLTVEAKPALLAGARLRIGGHVWDASLAAQLEAIPSDHPAEPKR